MSMKELLECKHPTVWIEFEKGLITEVYWKNYEITMLTMYMEQRHMANHILSIPFSVSKIITCNLLFVSLFLCTHELWFL